jgi:hypothetical protein
VTDIYTALAAVMADCDHVAKRDRNEHQRFLFRGIDAVVNAVGPVLRKHGVIVTPHLQDVAYDTVQTSQGKPATACRVQVAYIFYAPDGSSIETVVAAEAWDMGDKAAPKAMSVAFRTALLQALALPTDEPDPDSQSFERVEATRRTPSIPPSRPNDALVTPPQVTDDPGPQRINKPATRTMRRTAKPKPPDPDPDPVDGRLIHSDDVIEAMTGPQQAKMMLLFHKAGITQSDTRHQYIENVVSRPIVKSTEITKADASKVIDALEHDVAEQRVAPGGPDDEEPPY